MAKRPKIVADEAPLSFNPFAALGTPSAPETTEATGATEAPEPPASSELDTSAELAELRARLVVRRQKKGQGGKTVTCVEGLPAALRDALLPQIKRELGCSGRIEGEVVIAGTSDHARVADWLRRAGARVKLGN